MRRAEKHELLMRAKVNRILAELRGGAVKPAGRAQKAPAQPKLPGREALGLLQAAAMEEAASPSDANDGETAPL
jgi:hypothetical protein